MPIFCPDWFYSSRRVAKLLEEEDTEEEETQSSWCNPLECISLFRSLTCTMLSLVFFLASGILFVSVLWIIAFAVTTTQLKNGIREQTFRNIQSYTEHSLKIPRSITSGLIGFSYSRLLKDGMKSNITAVYPYMYDFLYQTYKHSLLEVDDFLNIDYISNENNKLQYVYFAGDRNNIQYHLVAWDGITNGRYSVYDIVDFETGEHSTNTTYEYLRTSISDSETALLAQWRDESTKIPMNTFVYHEPFLDCEANPYCVLFIELTYNVYRDEIWEGTVKTSMGGAGISDFLSRTIRDDATSFIIDRHKGSDGNRRNVIIASSTVDPNAPVNPLAYFINGKDNRPVLYPANEFPDDLVSAVATEVLAAEIPAGGALNYTHSTSFDVDVGNIYLEESQLDWLVVHVLPNTAFIQTPILLGTLGGIISVGLTLVALIIGIIVSCMIAIPLRRLMKQMQLIESMKLDSIKKQNYMSYFTEVQKIQRAFYFMKEKLQEWKSFLPAHLLPENDILDLDDLEERHLLDAQAGGGRNRANLPRELLNSVDAVDAGNGAADSPVVRSGKYKVHPLTDTPVGTYSGSPANHELSSDCPTNSSDPSTSNKNESTTILEPANNHPKWAHTPTRTLISQTLVKKQRFNRLLEQKSVCLMHIRITGFDKSISGMFSPKDFIIQHGALVEELISICRRLRGVLVHFDANDFVFGFNTTMTCKNYVVKACSLVETIRIRLKKMNNDWKRDAKEPLNLTIGIATGEAYVGNVGSHTHKKMTVFGHPRILARLLCDRAEDLGVDCLICDRTQRKLPSNDREAYQTRPLDVFLVPRLSRMKLFKAHQLLEYIKFEGDEWMYEVQLLDKMRKYNPCIEAFEHFEHEDMDQCMELYAKFEESLDDEYDKQLERLVEKMQDLKDSQLTYKQLLSMAHQRPLYQGHYYVSLLDMRREFGYFVNSAPPSCEGSELDEDYETSSAPGPRSGTSTTQAATKASLQQPPARKGNEVLLDFDAFIDPVFG